VGCCSCCLCSLELFATYILLLTLDMICTHFTDECRCIFVQGLPIVRAFRAEGRFFRTCCERIDDMNRFVAPSYTTPVTLRPRFM
jgi:hypothetical protein